MKAGKVQSTKDKFLKGLSNWMEKYIPSGTNETLIKTVIKALPIYAMGSLNFWWVM